MFHTPCTLLTQGTRNSPKVNIWVRRLWGKEPWISVAYGKWSPSGSLAATATDRPGIGCSFCWSVGPNADTFLQGKWVQKLMYSLLCNTSAACHYCLEAYIEMDGKVGHESFHSLLASMSKVDVFPVYFHQYCKYKENVPKLLFGQSKSEPDILGVELIRYAPTTSFFLNILSQWLQTDTFWNIQSWISVNSV